MSTILQGLHWVMLWRTRWKVESLWPLGVSKWLFSFSIHLSCADMALKIAAILKVSGSGGGAGRRIGSKGRDCQSQSLVIIHFYLEGWQKKEVGNYLLNKWVNAEAYCQLEDKNRPPQILVNFTSWYWYFFNLFPHFIPKSTQSKVREIVIPTLF